ncbi:MAG TPA: hypothetical protein VLY03_05250 [Bacteroidota bacterium]|nr:hypothetical protein [Bacteroidota bacterium]
MAPAALSQIYHHPFDSTWSNVIQYVATSPFHIDHFEKASGLITLSYTSTNPSELVSAGYLEAKGKKAFTGDYVDYLVREAEGELQGTINIIVLQVDPDRTKVSVKASYNFSATIAETGTYYWSFDTGTSDTRIVADGLMMSRDTITMIPTYRIEKNILNAIGSIQ